MGGLIMGVYLIALEVQEEVIYEDLLIPAVARQTVSQKEGSKTLTGHWCKQQTSGPSCIGANWGPLRAPDSQVSSS